MIKDNGFLFDSTPVIFIQSMGKKGDGHHVQQHKAHDHHDHHDTHDHHDQHTSQLRHDHAPTFQSYSSNVPNDPLNFTHKNPLFDLEFERKGPEFSTIDEQRLQYIQKFAGKLPLTEIHIPANLPGLVPKVGELPSNRRLWKPTSSFERNGRFNVHTHHFNTRSFFPFFFCFLLYGWWGHSTFAWYKMRYEDNDEILGNFYDKLNTRFPPPTKIWLRPA